MTDAEFMHIAFDGINVLKFQTEKVAILMIALAELYMFGDYSESVKTCGI